MRLPSMVYGDDTKKVQQVKFGGYNHTLAASDGEIYDMRNMSGLYFPLLSPRPKRSLLTTLTKPNGIFAADKLCWVDGTGFYYDGVNKGTVADSKKVFASLGDYIVIFPDKRFYQTETGAYGELEAVRTGTVTFQDGEIYGKEAEANTIYASGVDWGSCFRAGDGVTVSGCTTYTGSNKTVIVREIDGAYLRFSENCFVGNLGTESSVTVARTVPDMDFVFENNNRLWGCKGDMVYCSRPGDPFNFNVFETDDDCWQKATGTEGDFTGAVSYLGYPVFFKPGVLHKAYGGYPSNYDLVPSAKLGVAENSNKSLAVAGETLFYLSRSGPVAYTGGIPANISDVFGDAQYKNGVGGSDGLRYYLSMQDVLGNWHMFVYDTRRGLWHREDETHVLYFAFLNNLYYLDAAGKIWITGNILDAPTSCTEEDNFESYVEFGDFTGSSTDRKTVVRLLIRAEIAENSDLNVYIQYDSSGDWISVSSLTGGITKRTVNIPVRIKRCDHYRLKLTGNGQYAVYSITQDYSAGGI